jgi:L-serine kinase (ADP)
MGLLEQAGSPRGFSIIAAKIPILLALKRIDDLRPHEETVKEDLEGIVNALQQEPVLRHPIIADSTSGAVLDGTHRLAALKRLGCRTIPVALTDYQNPLIEVDRWFRTIKLQNPSELLKGVKRLSPVPLSDSEADKTLLDRSSYATLCDTRECLAFRSNDPAPLELCRHAFALEQIARDHHAKIAYTDKRDADNLSPSTITMSTIRLEKQEVVESCLKHQLFPPKSTRHLIPSRPLGLNIPLRWLKATDFPEAEREFEQYIAKMTVKRLPEGSVIGSRRYMEEVFLFESS